MQPFNRELKRQDIGHDLKSFGMCFLAVTTLVVGAFALVYLRHQLDHRSPVQSSMAYTHYPSEFEP